jgi:hypothetical protein
MKHIKLILASTMVIAAFAANAQDTTKLKVPPLRSNRIRQHHKIKHKKTKPISKRT